MQGVWGAEKRPGEFRTSQNWIGPAGAPLSRAMFVPPAVPDMLPALDSLEKFLHSGWDIPVLVHCALVHAQFETIHPFLDGNGRVGRLLITFQLVHREVLRTPLLYLSLFLKRRQSEYYYWLNAVREDGGWEGWVRFFLQGIAETAEEATATAVAIIRLREEHRELLQETGMGGQELRLLDLLYRSPLVSANWLKEALGLRNYQAAGRLIERLAALGLLEEITGRRRNRVYRYTPYWRLFEESYAGVGQDAPTQTTETEA
ncbi:MAG: Fic family protein [Chloroflexia bacterium]